MSLCLQFSNTFYADYIVSQAYVFANLNLIVSLLCMLNFIIGQLHCIFGINIDHAVYMSTGKCQSYIKGLW